MSSFKEYQSFISADAGQPLIELLFKHGVVFETGYDKPVYDAKMAFNETETRFVVRLHPEDFDRARALEDEASEALVADADPGHYLFGFSDDELFEVVMKRDEWSSYDVALAGRILRQQFRGRRHRRHRMAVIKRHITGKGVFLQVPIFAGQPSWKIGTGDHRLDAVQRQSLGGINPNNPRMGMGRAHHGGVQHSRRRNIRAVARAARDFVQAIGAVRAGADQTVGGFQIILRHQFTPRISAPASITARMILS